MHESSNDLKNTSTIYTRSLFFSFISFVAITLVIKNLQNMFDITVPFMIEIFIAIFVDFPSVIVLYSFYNWLFENVIWKHGFVKNLGLPKIPDLTGEWKATIITDSEGEKIKKADVKIQQTYSTFYLIMKTDESVSETRMAYFQVSNPSHQKLTYTYHCDPNSSAPDGFLEHDGTTQFDILESNTKLSGKYYSGKGRQHYGTIIMEKKAKEPYVFKSSFDETH